MWVVACRRHWKSIKSTVKSNRNSNLKDLKRQRTMFLISLIRNLSVKKKFNNTLAFHLQIEQLLSCRFHSCFLHNFDLIIKLLVLEHLKNVKIHKIISKNMLALSCGHLKKRLCISYKPSMLVLSFFVLKKSVGHTF